TGVQTCALPICVKSISLNTQFFFSYFNNPVINFQTSLYSLAVCGRLILLKQSFLLRLSFFLDSNSLQSLSISFLNSDIPLFYSTLITAKLFVVNSVYMGTEKTSVKKVLNL